MLFLLQVIFGAINAFLARKKGYNPVIWFFAGGFIGLIVLVFLPDTTWEGLNEEEVPKKVRKGNIIGIVIIVILMVLMALLALMQNYAVKKAPEFMAMAKQKLCRLYANQIAIALMQYRSQNSGKMPYSLSEPAFIAFFPKGALPAHPQGLSWDKYYHKEKNLGIIEGYPSGIIDGKSACDF
jgi:hypothetical protein